MSGTVLLIAGPSGSGKTTLTRALVNRVPFLTRAITVTTRLPRPGEVSGEDYHFVSPERFGEMKRAGALINCAETYTESYGIPRSVLAGLCDRALILTGGGALALRQRLSNSISIFIQPSSAAAAAARIVERNCPNSQSRIAGYQQEIAASSLFDRVFLNEDFDKTLDQIEDFYLSARRQRPNGRPAYKFDTGAGKGTGDGPVLGVPRLETGAKSGPCHNCIQGRFGLMADVYPHWFRPYKAIKVPGPRLVKEFCARAVSLGRSVPTPAIVPSEVTTGPEPVNAISDDKLRRSA
jgi:guanylate kinase